MNVFHRDRKLVVFALIAAMGLSPRLLLACAAIYPWTHNVDSRSRELHTVARSATVALLGLLRFTRMGLESEVNKDESRSTAEGVAGYSHRPFLA